MAVRIQPLPFDPEALQGLQGLSAQLTQSHPLNNRGGAAAPQALKRWY